MNKPLIYPITQSLFILTQGIIPELPETISEVSLLTNGDIVVNGGVISPPPWMTVNLIKRTAVLTFGEFRNTIDQALVRRHIDMETVPLDAVRIMGHACRWIIMPDYEIHIKSQDGLFEMAGVSGAHRIKTDIIKLEEKAND